jgi:hypothetical protein
MRGTVLALATAAIMSQAAPAAAQETAGQEAEDRAYAFEDIVYLTCAEAWEHAGQDVDAAVEMITVLAEFSLEKRGLAVVEDDPEVDEQFGTLIRSACTLDPDALLFAVVDRSIRRLAGE